jgi:hypothetical protein
LNFNKLLIVDHDTQRALFESPTEPGGDPYCWRALSENKMAEGCVVLIGVATPENCASIPSNCVMPVFHRCDGHWPNVFPSNTEAIIAGRELVKRVYQPVAISYEGSADRPDRRVRIIFTSARLFARIFDNGISEVGIRNI